MSLQKTSAGEVHLADRKFLIEERILNTEKCLNCRAETQRPTFYKTEGQNYSQNKFE
jgi:hypothetical protein